MNYIFRLTCFFFCAVLASMVVTSCGDDNSSQPAKQTKNLVRYAMLDSYLTGDSYSDYIFENNKLVRIEQTEDFFCDFDYVWSGNKVTEIKMRKDKQYSDTTTFTLQNGKIIKVDNEGNVEYKFTYDSDGHVTNIKIGKDKECWHETNCLWEGGKLLLVTTSFKDSIVLSYNGLKSKGFCPYLTDLVNNDYQIWNAMPQLIGVDLYYLPNTIEYYCDGELDTYRKFNYIMDSEGYIKEMEVFSDYSVGSQITSFYGFTWK